mgnify:FL=1
MATGIQNTIMSSDKLDMLKQIPIALSYEGKQPEDKIFTSHFTVHDRVFNVNAEGKLDNIFYWGDNFDILLQMLSENVYKEKIKLVYIDPPFATRGVFKSKSQAHAYSDLLSGGNFIEFLRKRLILLRELIAEDGSIYLHLDNNMAFAMKIIMDEIFGEKNFRAFITRRKCSNKNYTKNTYGNISDYILFYSKSANYVWNRPLAPWEEQKIIKEYPCVEEMTGRRYKKVPVHAPGIRNGATGMAWKGKMPPAGKHWQYTPARLDEMDANGEIYWSPSGNPRRKIYFDASSGIPIQDIWMDFRDSANQNIKTTGYPTEKNFEMLKQIVEASSNNGDYVLDCFCGSGTTLGAAHALGRKWIGVDNGEESLRAVLKRFVSGLNSYGDYVNKKVDKIQQMSFDFYKKKCAFNIITSEEREETVKKILAEIQNA